MIIDKYTTEEDFENLSFTPDEFFITKDIALDRLWLDFLCENFSSCKISILSGYDKNQIYYSPTCLYNVNETQVLADNYFYLMETYNKELTFDEGFSVEEAIVASEKINDLVDEITSARVNGKPLSPLEKYLYAYSVIVGKFYKEVDKNDSLTLSRNPIAILNGETIVCVGYVNLLSIICTRLGIPCTNEAVVSWDSDNDCYGNHLTLCVRMDDDKYDVHGIFHADPTADSLKKDANGVEYITFSNALIPYKAVPYFHSKPILIDAVITNLDAKYQTIQEAKEDNEIILTRKVLSYLFPEKNQNESQVRYLKNQALAELHKKNIFSKISDAIDDIDNQQIEQDLAEYFDDNVLNPKYLVYAFKAGFISILLKQSVSLLIDFGKTKEEIKNLLMKKYSENNIFLSLNKHGLKDAENDAKNLAKQIFFSISTFVKNIDDMQTETNYTFDKDNIFNELTESIAIKIIRNEFFGEFEHVSFARIQKLLNMGISLNEIKVKLKQELFAIDLARVFYLVKNMSNIYSTDERELYTGKYSPGYIYNKPYKKDFETLINLAEPPTRENFLDCLSAILISQGQDKQASELYAKQLLGNTIFSCNFGYQK